MSTVIRAAVAQWSPSLGDPDRNLHLLEEHVTAASEQGADLLVTPELGLTGYLLRDLVPDVSRTTADPVLRQAAALSKILPLVVGFVERGQDGLCRNAAGYFSGGDLVHLHRKVYLPTYGLFDEGRFFARGEEISTFSTPFGPLAILICEDVWHPSAVMLATREGASGLLICSAAPGRGIAGRRTEFASRGTWRDLLMNTCSLSGCWIAWSNRTGFEDGICFSGGSLVAVPYEEAPLTEAPMLEDGVWVAEVDSDRIARSLASSAMRRQEDWWLTRDHLSRSLAGKVPLEGGRDD